MAASAPRFSKPPAIRPSPTDPTRLYLECQVQATPKPTAAWFQNESPLSTTSTKHKQTIQLVSGNTYDVAMEIVDVGASDSGNFKVVLKNPTGEIQATLTLNFAEEDASAPAKR